MGSEKISRGRWRALLGLPHHNNALTFGSANEIAEASRRPCDLSWQRAQSHCTTYDWSRPTAASARATWDGGDIVRATAYIICYCYLLLPPSMGFLKSYYGQRTGFMAKFRVGWGPNCLWRIKWLSMVTYE